METSTYTKQLHKARENRFRFMEHELGGCFLLYSEIHRPFWVWSGPWPIRPACSSEGPSITGPRLQPGDRFALPQLTHPSALAPLHTQATWRGPARPGNVTLFQTCRMPWDKHNETSDQSLLYCFPIMRPECWEYSYSIFAWFIAWQNRCCWKVTRTNLLANISELHYLNIILTQFCLIYSKKKKKKINWK